MAQRNKIKWTRSPAGIYTFEDWIVMPTEGEDRSPGYNWVSHNRNGEESFHSTCASAKQYVAGRVAGSVRDPNVCVGG